MSGLTAEQYILLKNWRDCEHGWRTPTALKLELERLGYLQIGGPFDCGTCMISGGRDMSMITRKGLEALAAVEKAAGAIP